MHKNIDNVIKALSIILLALSIVSGVIWIVILISGGQNIVIPIIIILGSCSLSLLTYGFGEIITILHEINDKLVDNRDDENERKNINDYLSKLEK
jgi:hypothetical protein